MTFEEKDFKGKIEAIRKYYKNDKLFLETYFENYGTFNIYIRIDFVKKDNCYRLRWVDLDYLKTSNISKYVSSEFIENGIVEHLKFISKNAEISSEKFDLGKNDNIYFFLNSSTKNTKKIDMRFHKYILENCVFIYEMMSMVFECLPKKLYTFFEQVSGIITGDANRFSYEKKFRFDLFKDDLFELFDENVLNRGENYFYEKKVIFLEKIDDRYFSVVNGDELYLVVIKYDEISHDMEVYCSCPCDYFCKHVYAVIRAIREKNFNSFYKVMRKDNNESSDMFERLMNFNYSLSIGMIEDVLGIIGDDGDIEWVSILDEDKKSMWVVVDDDEKNSLSKAMTKLLNDSNK